MDGSLAFGVPWRSNGDLWQPVGPGAALQQPQRLSDFPAAVKELAFAVKEIQPPSTIKSEAQRPDEVRNQQRLVEICNIPGDRRNLRQVQFMASQLGELRRLKGVDSGCLRQAVPRMAGVSIPAKRQIITEGSEADAFYVIIQGSLGVYRNKGNSKTKIAMAGPGSCIGEIALSGKCPRTATVCTLSKSLLLKMKKEDFYSTIGASLAACIAGECRDLQQFAALGCCDATELIELTCSFEPHRFRPRDTLLMQGGGSAYDSHVYLVKSGTAAVFADPEFGSRPSRAAASKTVGACSLVDIITSGGVAGDWHLQRESLSAHVVALTVLDTYRIRRKDLLRRLRSPEAVRILYKEGHRHGLAIQARLGSPELPSVHNSSVGQLSGLMVGQASSSRSTAAASMSAEVHTTVRQQLGLESEASTETDDGTSHELWSEATSNSPEASPTGRWSDLPSVAGSDTRGLLPPLGGTQAATGSADDTHLPRCRVKMAQKLRSMPQPHRARSFNVRHVRQRARLPLVSSGPLLSVSALPHVQVLPFGPGQCQVPLAGASSDLGPSEGLMTTLGSMPSGICDDAALCSEGSLGDFGQLRDSQDGQAGNFLPLQPSRPAEAVEGLSVNGGQFRQQAQPRSYQASPPVGVANALDLGSGGPAGKLLSKINYYG